jgi:hypothetical protein
MLITLKRDKSQVLLLFADGSSDAGDLKGRSDAHVCCCSLDSMKSDLDSMKSDRVSSGFARSACSIFHRIEIRRLAVL